MRKKLIKLFVTTSILALIVICFLVYFNYYKIHFLFQPFTTNPEYDSAGTSYSYQITSIDFEMSSWEESSGTFYINILNTGLESMPNYCDVALTLVSEKTNEPIMIAINTDSSTWNSGTTTLEVPVDLRDVGFGYYSMYLRIWNDDAAEEFTLNNSLRIEREGYYLGTMSIQHIFQ